MRPKIENAPGITWRQMKDKWECRWLARSDLAKRGFRPSSFRVWVGTEPTPADIAYIQDRANSLQSEMLVWARGGILKFGEFDGTVKALAECYQTDPDSPYQKVRYVSRRYYSVLLKKLIEGHGDDLIADIKGRHVLRYYETWSEQEKKITMGHAMMGMFRTIVNFGMTILEDGECARLSIVLSKMRFKVGKARTERLTAEQATMIRKRAHERGMPSLALAQAIQFDGILRQKDVIGEWVPIGEPGVSDILDGQFKWLRGLRWEEIDDNLILRHITSKRQKLVEVPLSIAPMVMEELSLIGRKASGPVIIFEPTGMPWVASTFRQYWRKIADECGIPKEVRNMDSRAGAISEAADAGADIEQVRQAATHSDAGMTRRYTRNDASGAESVMRIRASHRAKNEPKTR